MSGSGLGGEVDFDDVLVISAIRAAEPDVFALIELYIDDLREGDEGEGRGKNDESLFVLKLNKALEAGTDVRRSALRRALGFVFPGWDGKNSGFSGIKKPQGLAIKTPNDYWARYMSMSSVVETPVNDQQVLRAIRLWLDGKPNGLVEVLAFNARHSGVVEHFAKSLLGRQHLVRLLEDVVGVETRRTHSQWPFGAPSSLYSVLRLMYEHRPDVRQLESSLKKLFSIVTPVDLPLASSLLHLFVTQNGLPELLSAESKAAVWERFYALLVGSFVPGRAWNKLADGLKDGEMHTLSQVVWGLERLRNNDTQGLPFSGWPQLSEVLLDAAEFCPKVVIPQILPFVVKSKELWGVDSGHPLYRRAYQFDEEAAGRLFNYGRLVSVVASGEALELPAESMQMYQSAREAAIHAQNSLKERLLG